MHIFELNSVKQLISAKLNVLFELLYYMDDSVLPARWHLAFPRFSGYFPSISLSDTSRPLNSILGLSLVRLLHTEFMASSLDCDLPASLAWAWTYPAGLSTCSWRSFPLRTGGQNLISPLSISPYPVEQDVLCTPNRSGNLPTAHIWALQFFRKMSSLFGGGGGLSWSKLIRFLLILTKRSHILLSHRQVKGF